MFMRWFPAFVAVISLTLSTALSASVEGRGAPWNRGSQKLCYEGLGCIETTDDWYDIIHRPINLNPASRQKIGTKFMLYTRDNIQGDSIAVSDKGELSDSRFDGNKDTKFIIHGFLGSAEADWVMDIMRSLLSRMDINVITVDWSKGAGFPYNQAAANTRVVAMEIAKLVNTLIEKKGAKAEKFHLIGHSLGAQTSGYAGERIQGLGRITGLDPAGPLFTGMPIFVRLDPSDADFVDVIHTDAEGIGFGIEEPCGDVDFYPNGGKRQPGCKVPDIPLKITAEGVMETFGEMPSCSHSRSELLFLESITSSPYLNENNKNEGYKCPFTAFMCDSYEDFLNGNCTTCGDNGMKCDLMGIDADKYPGKGKPLTKPRMFFLETNALSPYCGFHYAVNATLDSQKGTGSVTGDLDLTAFGDSGIAKMSLTENGPRKIRKGEANLFLGFSPSNSGKADSAKLSWDASKMNLCILCKKDLPFSTLKITNLGYYPGSEFKTSETCPGSKSTIIKSDSSETFSLRC